MKATDIIVRELNELTNNQNEILNIVLFVLDNPHLHKSIIKNENNFLDIIHDIKGLMKNDEFFCPRVLDTK